MNVNNDFQALGVDSARWNCAVKYAESLVESGHVPAISYQLVNPQSATVPVSIGVEEQSHFLIASLTKPVLAMTIMKLVEDGLLTLNQRVVSILPEFNDAAKRSITIGHLLTHTSGLPDMLSDNLELRQSQSPLQEFVKGTCSVDLLFPPGRGSAYQSMGFALLGEIISRVTGINFREFMRRSIFEPLGMRETWLGLPEELLNQIVVAPVRVPDEQQNGGDWNWNSNYWKQLGAPWGGMISTAQDLGRFCQLMLNQGTLDGFRLCSPLSLARATTNQLSSFAHIPEADRRCRGWGYGWRMNWIDQRGTFGDLLSPQVYGHWGATGTVFWVDPEQQIAFVALSTQPITKEVSPLVNLSNMVVAACN